jgi:signal transduction histidine kinase
MAVVLPESPSPAGPFCEWYRPGPHRARSLRSKMVISLAIVFGLGCFSTISALYSLSRVADKLKLIELSYELNQKVLETRRYEKNFLLYHIQPDLISALDYIDQVRAGVSQLKDTDVLPGEEINEYRTRLENYADVLLQLNTPENTPPPVSLKKKVRERGQHFTEYVLARDAAARLEAEEDARRYRRLSLVAMGVTLLFGGVLAIFLLRWVTQPLEYLRRAATRIMHGELTAIPMAPAVRGSLEGMELVNSLNLMLSSLVEKQEALIQSAKLATIGQVTAGLAHEVNNPLNNISLTAEVLLEELPADGEVATREMVGEILAQTERAREVVQNLLVFIRMAKTTEPVVMDLVQITEDSIGLLKNQIRLSQIQVETDFSREPLRTKGFPSQIEQVLVNIMLNAIQAMALGGSLTVRVLARPEERLGVVEIGDTGPGISAEDKKRIFDPFFTTKSDGTGLGLSVSYSIIEKHEGNITLESEPGRGTIFRVALPLLAGEPVVAVGQR